MAGCGDPRGAVAPNGRDALRVALDWVRPYRWHVRVDSEVRHGLMGDAAAAAAPEVGVIGPEMRGVGGRDELHVGQSPKDFGNALAPG